MKKTDNKKKKTDRSDKFTYSAGDIKFTTKKKKVKESYSSFAEFLFEKEEKFVASTMRWITIKDERDRNQHILIKKKDGTIIAGMGGKHNGEKLGDVFDDLEDKREDFEKKEQKKKEEPTTSNYAKEIEEFREYAINEYGVHDVYGLKEDDITQEQYESIEEYTGDSYTRINNFYRDYDKFLKEVKENSWYDRDDYDTEEEYEEAIADEIAETEGQMEYFGTNISIALAKHKSKEDMITYRGLAPDLISQIKDNLAVENEFSDDGFASSSTDINIAKNFSKGGYVMEIHIPKGSRAASVKHLSKHSTEDEVLIDKGSSFFIKEVNHDKKTLVVELRQK